jgi:hypothetical protein
MDLFFLSLIAFIVFVLALMVSLGLWTYKDAKVKSDQSPALWVLVVLLVPNFLGIVIYLLVGRTKKDVPAPGDFKKTLITFAVLAGLAFVVFISSTVRFMFIESSGDRASSFQSSFMSDAFGNVRSGTFVGFSSNRRDNEWRISAARSNGFIRISPRLDENALARLSITGNSGEGEIFLRLEQNEQAEEININEYNGPIDTSGFSPGLIRMTLLFESARDVRLTVSWQ